MKFYYGVRWCVCFIYSATFFMYMLSGNAVQLGYVIVSSLNLAIFPAMVLGSLIYSLVPGSVLIWHRLRINYRFLSLGVMLLALMIFTFNPNIYYVHTPYLLTAVLLGLALGYLYTDLHVLIFRCARSPWTFALAAGVFVCGYVLAVSLHHMMNWLLPVEQPGRLRVLFYWIAFAAVVILMITDRSAYHSHDDSDQAVITDFALVLRRLSFLLMSAWQMVAGWTVIQLSLYWDQYLNQWLIGFPSDRAAVLVTGLPMLFSVLLAIILVAYIKPRLINLSGQGLVFAGTLLCLGHHLWLGSEVFLLNSAAALLYSGLVILAVSVQAYIIAFFRSGLLTVFIPVTVAIMLFFITMVVLGMPLLRLAAGEAIPFTISFLLGSLVICGLYLVRMVWENSLEKPLSR